MDGLSQDLRDSSRSTLAEDNAQDSFAVLALAQLAFGTSFAPLTQMEPIVDEEARGPEEDGTGYQTPKEAGQNAGQNSTSMRRS